RTRLRRCAQSGDALGAALGSHQGLANVLSDDLEALVDGHLAYLGRPRLAALGIELGMLADQALELAHVLQEGVGALVLARSGLGGLAGVAAASGRLVVSE